MKQGCVISLTVLSVNKSFTTGMSDGTLKAFEKNTSIDVAKVKRERLRDGGRKPGKHISLQKIVSICDFYCIYSHSMAYVLNNQYESSKWWSIYII